MSERQPLTGLQQLSEEAGMQHLPGSLSSTDLNVNLLAFTGTSGIDEHTNAEVDVLVVAVSGEGVLTVDGDETLLTAGQATIISKGAARSIRSAGVRFV